MNNIEKLIKAIQEQAEKFLEEYRNPNNYQPKSKSANRSHKYEKK